MMSMTLDTLIGAAADLHGPDPENVHPEYTRALVELVGSFLPGNPDNIKGYLYPLISGGQTGILLAQKVDEGQSE